MNKNVIFITGPTAIGKTLYAIELAKAINGEIISADSMQIYKYMDIGSAKPSAEELQAVKHYLVDEIDPREDFSVAEYQKIAKKYINKILDMGKVPIISGGTGLYINSLLYDMDFSVMPKQDSLRQELEEEARLHGNDYIHNKLLELDEEAASRIHPNNVKKVIRAIEVTKCSGEGMSDFSQSFVKTKDYNSILICLTRDREELYDRINMRVDILIQSGLVEEIKGLLEMGLTEENISMKGIGYKEILRYLSGEYDLEEGIRLVKRNTRHYAKRQLTWFRRYNEAEWINLSHYNSKEAVIDAINGVILCQQKRR